MLIDYDVTLASQYLAVPAELVYFFYFAFDIFTILVVIMKTTVSGYLQVLC